MKQSADAFAPENPTEPPTMEALAPENVSSVEIPSASLEVVLDRLRNFTEDAPLGEALEVAEEFVSVSDQLPGLDQTYVKELKALADNIARTRSEIAALQPKEISQHRIPEAGKELEAIVQHTEDATNTIMKAAEAIMDADPSDIDNYELLIHDKIMQIFEACSFQDITGQRISKVISTFTYIENRMHRLLEASGIEDAEFETDEEKAAKARAEENLLHGPQLGADGAPTDATDDVFCQDDIDALFD